MTPVFLDLADVLEIHETRVQLYGGSPGLRDLSLLISAIEQPQAGFGGEYLHNDLFEMAAAYLFTFLEITPWLMAIRERHWRVVCCS